MLCIYINYNIILYGQVSLPPTTVADECGVGEGVPCGSNVELMTDRRTGVKSARSYDVNERLHKKTRRARTCNGQ